MKECYEVRILSDGWTVVKIADGKRSAHFEHTIAITDGGAEILRGGGGGGGGGGRSINARPFQSGGGKKVRYRVARDMIELVGFTPLVRINHIVPNRRIKVYAKLERYNPAGSVKDRIAKYMISRRKGRGS